MFKKLPLKAKLSLLALPILLVALAFGYYLSQQQTSTESFASSCEPCYEKCEEKYPGLGEDADPASKSAQKDRRQRCRDACRQRQHCESEPKPTCDPHAKCGDGSCQPECGENKNCPKDCGG